MKTVSKLVLAMILIGGGLYATPTFTVSPVLAAGEPGSTVGWGYNIINDTSFYLLFDNSAFCGPGGDPFLNSCTPTYDGVTNFGPAIGTYNDFIATNFTFVAPFSTISQGFNATATPVPTGIGSYVINANAPVLSTDPANPQTQVSNLFLQYEEWNGNPLQLSSSQVPGTGEFEMSAQVEVQATPEPGTWALLSAALAIGLLLARRRTVAARVPVGTRRPAGTGR